MYIHINAYVIDKHIYIYTWLLKTICTNTKDMPLQANTRACVCVGTFTAVFVFVFRFSLYVHVWVCIVFNCWTGIEINNFLLVYGIYSARTYCYRRVVGLRTVTDSYINIVIYVIWGFGRLPSYVCIRVCSFTAECLVLCLVRFIG